MRVGIFGATGRTGRRIVRSGLDAGFDVSVLVRDRSHAEFGGSVAVTQGDVTDYAAVVNFVAGCDAIASAVGPRSRSTASRQAYICTSSTSNIVKAMMATGRRRYVLVSSASLVMPTDRRNFVGTLTRFVGPLMLGSILTDKKREYGVLRDCDLDWTIVRAPEIVDGAPSGKALVQTETHTSLKVLSGDVAQVMVDQVCSDRYLRQGIFVSANVEGIYEEVTRAAE